MSVLLLTGYTKEMSAIGDLTSPLMAQYARKHGLNFRKITNYDPRTHPSWQKVELSMKAMAEGMDVLWMDADTIVTNFEITPWKAMRSKLHVSQDWGIDATEPHHFSMGNFFAPRDCMYLFQSASRNWKEYGNKPLWEQSCFQEMARVQDDVRSMIKVHPRRTLNAVPIIAQLTAQEPWQDGDWLCHLTGINNEERVEIFHRIRK